MSKNEFNPDYENNPKVLKGVISDLQIALEAAEERIGKLERFIDKTVAGLPKRPDCAKTALQQALGKAGNGKR